MWIKEVIRGMVRKPFVVNWSEMSPSYVIIAKQKCFRTFQQMQNFIGSLQYNPDFIRVNAVRNLDVNLGLLRYDG